jgi:hypothetical protein
MTRTKLFANDMHTAVGGLVDALNKYGLADAHSASKRQPPPAPYTAADPPVPPEPVDWKFSAGPMASGGMIDVPLSDRERLKAARDALHQVYAIDANLCHSMHVGAHVEPLRPGVAIKVTDAASPAIARAERALRSMSAEALADAIFERAASDGALHRSSLVEVLRRHGIAP